MQDYFPVLLKQYHNEEDGEKHDEFAETVKYHRQLTYEEENEDLTVEAITAEELFVNLISSLDLAEWATNNSAELIAVNTLLKKLGAVATLTVDRDTMVVRLEILVAALQVHGYDYGNFTIIENKTNLNTDLLDAKSKRIMNRMTYKVRAFKREYFKKLDSKQVEQIRYKHVDLVSIVILAIFDVLIQDKTDNVGTRPVLPTHLFYQKLVRMAVKNTEQDAPNLTVFLAYKNNN